MHRVTIRSNVVELLVAITASTTVAVLVFVGGLAIGEGATSTRGATMTFAVAPSEGRLATPEYEEIRPTAYLCCALIYADPSMTP
jgi:hypothetical protein